MEDECFDFTHLTSLLLLRILARAGNGTETDSIDSAVEKAELKLEDNCINPMKVTIGHSLQKLFPGIDIEAVFRMAETCVFTQTNDMSSVENNTPGNQCAFTASLGVARVIVQRSPLMVLKREQEGSRLSSMALCHKGGSSQHDSESSRKRIHGGAPREANGAQSVWLESSALLPIMINYSHSIRLFWGLDYDLTLYKSTTLTNQSIY
nr:hypothetical protein [Salmonid herpesvirus 1]